MDMYLRESIMIYKGLEVSEEYPCRREGDKKLLVAVRITGCKQRDHNT